MTIHFDCERERILSLQLYSAHECRELCERASSRYQWKTATVHEQVSEGALQRVEKPDIRLAETLAREDGLDLFEEIEARILRDIGPALGSMGCELQTLASTQMVRYPPGGHYRPHRDSGGGLEHDRKFTVLVYLNDDFSGGATVFPEMDYELVPRRGRAILFPSDYLHAAQPVVEGEKYIIVSWLVDTAAGSPTSPGANIDRGRVEAMTHRSTRNWVTRPPQ